MVSAPSWTPTSEWVANSELTRFTALAESSTGARFADYAALHRWSIDRPEEFWPLLWNFLGIIADPWPTGGPASPDRDPRTRVLTGHSILGARWFPDVRLSFSENLLRRRDDHPALIARDPQGGVLRLSFHALYEEVGRWAAVLRDLGVAPGERVVAVLPNAPEAMIAMLAANALGAVWSICALDLGAEAVVDRFGQLDPAILILSSRLPRDKAQQIIGRLPTLRCVLAADGEPPDGASSLPELAAKKDAQPIVFERLAFDAPAFILFTSGTTGRPKCIVHGMGGMLLQLLKEHRLHYDLRRDDRFFYFTSTGWNMWYWVAIALAAEATTVLFEGSPFNPSARTFFDLAEAEALTVLGVSPSYLRSIMAAGVRPIETHRLDRLRTILSTGSPLAPELYDYVYSAIKRDVCLSSISGGTEINACFATGNPNAPVHRGELTALALGMRVEIFDDDGVALERGKGELVCTAPFPSRPIGFWNDPQGERFRATYFERFPGIWHHGDLAERTEHGGLIIHGRSDATLKPGGFRIGTAEIYGQVETFEEVADSIVIAQDWQGDVRIVLFVELREGRALTPELRKRIRERIAGNTSVHHVPARIVQVTGVPRTRNGKKAELAVRSLVHGRPVTNASSLENPETLEHYASLRELAT